MDNIESIGIAGLAIYFLPAIVALSRGHLSWGAIFAFNLLLGWTLIFWILALVWSLTYNTRANQRIASGVDRANRAMDLTLIQYPAEHAAGLVAVQKALNPPADEPIGVRAFNAINRWAADYASRHPN